jgi:hypothetical protein
MRTAVSGLVSLNSRSTFLEAAKAVFHPSTVFVLLIAALLAYLANRSHANLDDTAFLASITVLVFLLPAAGIVGSYLLTEVNEAVSIIANAGDDAARNEAQTSASTTLTGILNAAMPLQRGFTYTVLAVLISAVALVHTNKTVGGVDIDRILSAASLALLVGTALSVFPMTWRLLQLKEVQAVHQRLKPSGTGPATAVDTSTPPPPARPRNGLGVAALVLGVTSLVAALSFLLFPLGLLGGLVAAVLGITAVTRRRKNGATNTGQASAGIICGVLALAVAIVFSVRFGTFAALHTNVFTTFANCIAKASNRSALSSCIARLANDIRP